MTAILEQTLIGSDELSDEMIRLVVACTFRSYAPGSSIEALDLASIRGLIIGGDLGACYSPSTFNTYLKFV